ncbi:hypothetical protein [Streptomyces flaveolus]|uniref:hypothetical protein n=1 Tax=Streptomyces flaveolus TaxID=67297 RepID=UPI00340FEA55
MKMTETYAATIAAVAPVIWLVAAVEVQQYVKRYESMTSLGDQVLRLRRYAEQVEGRMTTEQLDELMRIAREGHASFQSSFRQAPVKKYVSAAYLVVVGVLLAAESASLVWLAGPQKDTPVVAWFCLISVLLGFLAVSALPAVVAFGVAASVATERQGDMDWVNGFLERQRSLLRDEDAPRDP